MTKVAFPVLFFLALAVLASMALPHPPVPDIQLPADQQPANAAQAAEALDNLELGWVYSTKHPESAAVIEGARTLAMPIGHTQYKKLKRGDTVTIKGALGKGQVQGRMYVNILIERRSVNQMDFIIMEATKLYDFGATNGLQNLGQGKYYLPQDLTYSGSWTLSDRTHNGHGEQGRFLTIGEGYARYAEISAAYYSAVWDMAEIVLPEFRK